MKRPKEGSASYSTQVDYRASSRDLKQAPGNMFPTALLATALCILWQYRLWSFKSGDTKLERFLLKNQHTQRKLLNFENWTNGEPQ